MKIEFELEEEEAIIKTVYESIKEEREDKNKLEDKDSDKKRSFVAVALKGTKLSVCISGDDIVKLRAAANTWLRLSKIAEEMVEVVRKHES